MLESRVRELIYVATGVSTTHSYDPGTRIHMRNAPRYGATPGELMELTSVLGIHSITSRVPILVGKMRAADR